MSGIRTEQIIEEAMLAFHDNKVEEAFELLNHSLLGDFNNIDILNALGDLNYLSDNPIKALGFWEKSLSINTSQVDILFNVALIHHQNNEYKKALELYNKILAINPNDVESLNNRGNVYRKLRMYDKAVEDYESAIEKGFKTFEVFFNLAISFDELNLYEDAIHSYAFALSLNSNIPEIYLNFANCLTVLGRYEESLQLVNQGLIIGTAHDQAKLINTKGIVLLHQYKWHEALECFDRAIEIDKDYAEAHNNKACIFMYGNRSQSEEFFISALKIKPDYIDAKFNLATFYLSNGRYEEGWKAYECRYNLLKLKKIQSTHWTGKEEVKNKVVYVYPEQGFGDFIQFCRYLPILDAMGAKIWLEVPKPLESIVRTLNCKFKLVESIKEGFDFHCPIMSLPLALKTNIRNIPAPKKYLYADPEKIIRWGKKLESKKRLRIGVVWQGGTRKNDPRSWGVNNKRNIKINLLKELFTQDIDIFSLQKGIDAEEELRTFNQENIYLKIHDYTEMLLDFSDTAALIENLDLVITVDTSVAHLSAALGKETWILNRFDTCWRWFSDHRTSSPWYPSVRIFTQKEPGKWEGVLSEVVIELKNKLSY
ncbi:tetratricopeptide repeat protein [Candidatus Methylopumilus universalis]|uniref:tetratricopeptide repeat protein n=1 Tax=Candidatus Methylopumilus universalis TaxID=2588536 RepID=UPI003BEF4059